MKKKIQDVIPGEIVSIKAVIACLESIENNTKIRLNFIDDCGNCFVAKKDTEITVEED